MIKNIYVVNLTCILLQFDVPFLCTPYRKLSSISVPDTVFKYTATSALYQLSGSIVNDFVDVYSVYIVQKIERIVYHILSHYLKISEFHPHYIRTFYFFDFFSSGSTTSIELTFYSVLYAFPYFPRSWEGFKQGIRIKGREVTLVWHEQASRTALQTSSLLHTHTPSVQTHNMTTYVKEIAEKCSQL